MACQYTTGKITLIVNELPLPNGDHANLAIHMCRRCGQAFANDTVTLSQLSAAAKVSLSAILNQLPQGRDIFANLCCEQTADML